MGTGGKQGEEENVEKFFMLAVGLDRREEGAMSPQYFEQKVYFQQRFASVVLDSGTLGPMHNQEYVLLSL